MNWVQKLLIIGTLIVSGAAANATPVSMEVGDTEVCPLLVIGTTDVGGAVHRVEYLDLVREEIITFYEARNYPLFLSPEYIDELTERCRENLESGEQG